jgi:hypothetical protein
MTLPIALTKTGFKRPVLFLLPEAQRVALYGALRGDALGDIADQLGRSKAAVSCLIQRGQSALRRCLDPSLPAEDQVLRRPLDRALLDYLSLREQGTALDRAALLGRHASCAKELEQMLDWLEGAQSLLAAAP